MFLSKHWSCLNSKSFIEIVATFSSFCLVVVSQLESLKQGANLRKDTEDQSILNNTYDGSDSPRFDKNMTNERRRKLPPKKGVENRGFIDDEGKDVERETPKRTKKKKKSETTSIIDR